MKKGLWLRLRIPGLNTQYIGNEIGLILHGLQFDLKFGASVVKAPFWC